MTKYNIFLNLNKNGKLDAMVKEIETDYKNKKNSKQKQQIISNEQTPFSMPMEIKERYEEIEIEL